MGDNHLAQLPEELLQASLRFLDGPGLVSLAQSSSWSYEKAIPFIWHDVELVDCRTRHFTEDVPYHSDEHDDTPIIRKLVVLASKPWIASHVHTITHRCHLPPPALFAELPKTNFQSRFLSHDPRTLQLLDLACANLTHIQTLRIVFGHWHITKGLLNGILDKSRKRVMPLRKLWLENCALTGLSAHMLSDPDLGRLESLRLRRLQLLPHTGRASSQQVYTRGQSTQLMQDGQGSQYMTTTDQWNRQEVAFGNAVHSWGTPSFAQAFDDWEKMFESSHIYDDMVYDDVIRTSGGDLDRYRNELWDHRDRVDFHIQKIFNFNDHDFPAAESDSNPFPATMGLIQAAADSLTSLNLDWVITRRIYSVGTSESTHKPMVAFRELFKLRFPNLRAFQVRNAVVKESRLPEGLYLLDECSTSSTDPELQVPRDMCIDFMEAHPKLICLAWPMDAFFSGRSRSEQSGRVSRIIDTLAQHLFNLRVDVMYSPSGETQSDVSADGAKERANRRRFISDFASRMRKLEHVKMEGCIPRDERRETVRALGNCPLRKIVLIGVNSPVGNTWGLRGQDVETLGINEDLSDPDDLETLEDEHYEAIAHLGASKPTRAALGDVFQAEYGWPPSPPLIHTLAAYHADTITELKFCGYRGAPLLWEPTQVTYPMYSPLRHFHRLQSVVLSLWLQTFWENDYRDKDIIAYWLNSRSPQSTALAVLPDQPLTGWAKQLADRFEPYAIARRLKDFIGPFLSETAKASRAGVHVRGSFCIGMFGGIYDVDIHVGKGGNGEDVLLDWIGLREELHPDRRREKLERRRWF
ncbi:hypothetical protein AAFC00_005820 [Neodothiora populina]